VNCEELLAVLHDFVGGELVIEQRQTVEVHITGCERCGILVHSYTHTVRVASVLRKCGPLPPEVEARLRAVIEPELKKAGEPK
jgi:anti-sigma factor RsiW